MIDKYPKTCNLCGGTVIFTSNAVIYGREYGSGRCYLCTKCGAFVGTHKPWPREAMGLLADARMRKGKKLCHSLFDPFWRGKPKAQKKRQDLYFWLSTQLDIPFEDCHFGHFDLERLRAAYRILLGIQGREMRYDNRGMICFSVEEVS